MSNIYTEQMKFYDKITEASLINLHGLAIRNDNILHLGKIDRKNKTQLFFIEVANMLNYTNKNIKIYVSFKNKLHYILFKLKNRHLVNIKYDKNSELNEEFNKIFEFMLKDFEIHEYVFSCIYDMNFNRKVHKNDL